MCGMDWSRLAQRLEPCLGPGRLAIGSDGLPHDEVPVRVVCTPAAVDGLRDVIRIAAAERAPIYPLGGRTMLDLGLPGRADGIGLSTVGLDHVIDYPSR